jgi:26S proteasome regulatory subunit N5
VVSKLVKEVYKYLDETPDTSTKIELIKSLRTVTAGKIYVELEYARLTKLLAEIKEAAGDVEEAASILQVSLPMPMMI